MSVRSHAKSVRRTPTSVDDHLNRIRRRIEWLNSEAVKRVERLKRFLANEGEPRTREDFERLSIQLELAHAAVAEVTDALK